MPTWGDLLEELKQSVRDVQEGRNVLPPGVSPDDALRRKYLASLAAYTGRNAIVYASDFLTPSADARHTTIQLGDVQGCMETVHGLKGDDLDLILHLPGGSAEASEAVLSYLRKKFAHIRAIVPHAAMSAATMLACGADEIVMGAHSFLGPIDPQMVMRIDGNTQIVPAQAVLDQFELAKRECQDAKKMAAWLPMLKQYGPGLLVQCRHHQQLAEELVGKWLASYMLKGSPTAGSDGKQIAAALAAHTNFRSHNRPIDREHARSLGLKVFDLEQDQQFQDLVLSVYHATTLTFQGAASKILENHLGKAFVQLRKQVTVQAPRPQQTPAQTPRSSNPGQSKAQKKNQSKRGRRKRRGK